MLYDKQEDVLNIEVNKGKYWKSSEVNEGVVIDIAEDGSILGIEVLGARKILRTDAKKIIAHAKSLSRVPINV